MRFVWIIWRGVGSTVSAPRLISLSRKLAVHSLVQRCVRPPAGGLARPHAGLPAACEPRCSTSRGLTSALGWRDRPRVHLPVHNLAGAGVEPAALHHQHVVPLIFDRRVRGGCSQGVGLGAGCRGRAGRSPPSARRPLLGLESSLRVVGGQDHNARRNRCSRGGPRRWRTRSPPLPHTTTTTHRKKHHWLYHTPYPLLPGRSTSLS